MLFRAAYFCAALAVALCGLLLGTPALALADSGGYRRPDISAQYGSSSASGWTAPSSGGYRRPSTSGGGYASSSAGDLAISRSTSAQALRQYRASQQRRRPSVETTARSGTAWGNGGYAVRRPPSYTAPAAVTGVPAATVRRHSGPCLARCRRPIVRPISDNPRSIPVTSNGASRSCATLRRRRDWRRSATAQVQRRAMSAQQLRARRTGSSIVLDRAVRRRGGICIAMAGASQSRAESHRQFRSRHLGQHRDTLPCRPNHPARSRAIPPCRRHAPRFSHIIGQRDDQCRGGRTVGGRGRAIA